jgi:ubiquitin carboxyl-terminal hydrolase L3
MSRLLRQCEPLDAQGRINALEGSDELESVYASVARKGDTEAPANPEDDVEFHYNAFVKSHKNGHLFLLDGGRRKPVDLGEYPTDQDVLAEDCLKILRNMVSEASEDPRSINFGLMALAPAHDM